MQTQDVPGEFIFKLWPWIEANKNRLIGAAVALVVFSGILFFISSHREQREVDAGQALTALLVNPTTGGNGSQMAIAFEQVADKYTGTPAGQRARLQAAAALFDNGSYQDAQTQFQKYLTDSPTGPFAATAALGLAASLEAQNKLDEAAADYQRVISLYPGSACVAQAEFGLGRITEGQNKLSEALSHFQNAARVNQAGALTQEAEMRAAELEAKLAAAAPKPSVKPLLEAAPKTAVSTQTMVKP
jgi:TolA-binding protein